MTFGICCALRIDQGISTKPTTPSSSQGGKTSPTIIGSSFITKTCLSASPSLSPSPDSKQNKNQANWPHYAPKTLPPWLVLLVLFNPSRRHSHPIPFPSINTIPSIPSLNSVQPTSPATPKQKVTENQQRA